MIEIQTAVSTTENMPAWYKEPGSQQIEQLLAVL